jgi:hypothetical protein
MTVTLELTADIEQAIERKAQRQGITSSEYLRRMAERAARPSKARKVSHRTDPRSQTPAEFIAELDAEGTLNGYGDPAIDSPELARQIRIQASRPQREAAE